jgi:uncharacterized membrane protein YgcG
MANKPVSRNWNDIQVVIATVSMAVTLAFWNMFAGPDRASAEKRAQEQAALPPEPIVATAPQVVTQPTPLGDGKILFGGTAPQTQIIVHGNGGGGGGNNGGGGGSATGGGAVVTSTKSS